MDTGSRDNKHTCTQSFKLLDQHKLKIFGWYTKELPKKIQTTSGVFCAIPLACLPVEIDLIGQVIIL